MPDDEYLDLAGNKQQMEGFVRLIERFRKGGFNAPKWKLGEFIELLKEFRKGDKEIFPFQVVRAQDFSSPNKDFQFHFNDLSNFTNLNPRLIICFFVKSEVYLQNKKIVFER